MTLGPDEVLDDDGDLDISGGDSKMRVDFAQAVRIALKFIYGEWFLDRDRGIRYKELILVKNPQVPHITAIFRDAILAIPGAKSVPSLTVLLDAKTRVLSVEGIAISDTGSVSFSELLG